ncbi:MAG: KamA family radical SAM protein [Candidatus Latescibacterota bacterium]
MMESTEQLRKYLPLTDAEAADIKRVGAAYPWRITEYYAFLMDPADPGCPIRKQAVPDLRELDTFGSEDPLEEEACSPAPGVIRVYPDRIAVVVTDRCPMYCRHCLRKRFRRDASRDLRDERLERVLAYIRGDSSIRDVLLTGGDPLMLPDIEFEAILRALRAIDHVEIIRVGTRALCTWPERITDALADMLAAYHPIWVNTQFNHPREITPEAERAVDTLLRRGIPVGNQSVLLKGINDSVPVMLELIRRLVRIRVRPYYLYQAQTLSGTGHFVTPIERGLEIMRGLRGWTTGFAVPQYILDTPYGKIPLNPQYVRGRQGEYMEMESWSGKVWREWNPPPGAGD